ncbi:hypothetical protein J2S34_002438 [Nitrobacter winogradskyi]|uniref:Uncharacterized protein n=1 Tax=Nitrobacter winogradskyi TaxID=913 RepID=A0ACC6AJF0_NITWI|nr:hypothetical protein [Nitrobacter winogradskyi]
MPRRSAARWTRYERVPLKLSMARRGPFAQAFGYISARGIRVGQTSVAKYMVRRGALRRRVGRRSFGNMLTALAQGTFS